MKTCAYCGTLNVESAVACSGCGTDEFKQPDPAITPALAGTGVPPEFIPVSEGESGHDWVTLLRCGTLIEADQIAGQLAAQGITSFIPDQFLMQAMSFYASACGFVRVQVAPADYEAARELLATPAPPPLPPSALGLPS